MGARPSGASGGNPVVFRLKKRAFPGWLAWMPALLLLYSCTPQGGRKAPEMDRAAQTHILEARRLMEQGQVIPASHRYEQACKLAPHNAEAWAGLGRTYLVLAGYDQAVDSCRRATTVQPGYADGHTCLGIALRLTGRAAEAEAELREAVRLHPAAAEANAELVRLLLLSGRTVEALAEARAAQERTRSEPRLPLYESDALLRLGRVEEALPVLETLVRSHPDWSAAWLKLSEGYRAAGRSDESGEALRRYREILEGGGHVHGAGSMPSGS